MTLLRIVIEDEGKRRTGVLLFCVHGLDATRSPSLSIRAASLMLSPVSSVSGMVTEYRLVVSTGFDTLPIGYLAILVLEGILLLGRRDGFPALVHALVAEYNVGNRGEGFNGPPGRLTRLDTADFGDDAVFGISCHQISSSVICALSFRLPSNRTVPSSSYQVSSVILAVSLSSFSKAEATVKSGEGHAHRRSG